MTRRGLAPCGAAPVPRRAVIVAWDDWGGFYDHVPPPTIDGNGYGFRVPSLIISPWAKHCTIDPQTMSFDAYNAFIEDLFLNGQHIDPRTDGRPDPRLTPVPTSTVGAGTPAPTALPPPVIREAALPTTTPGASASLLFDFNFSRTSNFDPPTVAPTPTGTVLATSTPPVPDTTWCNS